MRKPGMSMCVEHTVDALKKKCKVDELLIDLLK